MLWSAQRGDIERCFALFRITPPFMIAALPKSVTDPIARCLETLLAFPDASKSQSFSAACCAAMHLLIDAEEHRIESLEARARVAPDDMFAALALAAAPGRRGDMAGGRALSTLALERAGDDGDPLFRADILALLTIFETVVDPVAGRRHAEESVEVARRHGGGLACIYPLLALTMAASRTDVKDAFDAANECSSIDRTSRRVYSSVAIGIAAHAAAEHGDLERAVPLWRNSIDELHRSSSRTTLALTIGTVADAIASRHQDAALDLVCLAESGAIAPIGILANEYYTNIRAVASTCSDSDLARRRQSFAALAYEDAVARVLDILDNLD
jgi:hypothetical protein